MLIRLLKATFKRQKRRVILAILAVAIGASLVTALLNISLSLERKVQRDLRKYGANILVIPKSKVLPLEIGGINYRPEKQAYLSEADLPKIKIIFTYLGLLVMKVTEITLLCGKERMVPGPS